MLKNVLLTKVWSPLERSLHIGSFPYAISFCDIRYQPLKSECVSESVRVCWSQTTFVFFFMQVQPHSVTSSNLDTLIPSLKNFLFLFKGVLYCANKLSEFP